MMKTFARPLILGSVAVLGLAACGKSTSEPGGESEIISRVTLTLTPPSGGAVITAYIDDPDGNGPQAPTAQVGALALTRGVTYSGAVRFENRLASPVQDITTEVRAEANEHRVFYTVTGTGVTVNTTDVDSQNRPLGLAFSKVLAASATAGSLRVVLCHYGSTSKVATATSCMGDTDVSQQFAFTVN